MEGRVAVAAAAAAVDAAEDAADAADAAPATADEGEVEKQRCACVRRGRQKRCNMAAMKKRQGEKAAQVNTNANNKK
jgi:hypothetical protein